MEHADSIALLERDVRTLSSRWTGDAAEAAFDVIGKFITLSYDSDVPIGGVVRDVISLSETADKTYLQFKDAHEPSSYENFRGHLPGGETSAEYRAKLAAEVTDTYSRPLQQTADTFELGENVKTYSFDNPGTLLGPLGGGPPGVGVDNGGNDKGGPGGIAGTGGGGAPTGPVGGTRADGPMARRNIQDEKAGLGRADQPNVHPAAAKDGGASPGCPAPSGGLGTPGDQSMLDSPEQDGYPSDESDPFGGAPLMSSPIAPGSGGTPVLRGGGAGVSGGIRPGSGVPSPLGMRQFTPELRGVPGNPLGGPTNPSLARPAAGGGMGGVPHGAGGGRGQQDRHRTPGYLIDKANGEEIVGELPQIGPSVLGDWRPEHNRKR